MTERAKRRSKTTTRIRKQHAVLRAAGLRLVEIWVPDTRRAGFSEECRLQSLLLKGDAHERGITNWLEQAADHEGWQ